MSTQMIRSALEAAAGHRAEPDHPRAEHDAGRARLTLAVLIAAPRPVERPQANSGLLRLGLGRDLGQRDLRHHRVLGERARAHEVAHRLAVARQAGGAVGEVALVLLLADGQAQVGLRAAAVHALAALGREQGDDAVAGGKAAHALAEGLDDARPLVPEHGRRVARRVRARGGVHVGVADAAGLQPDQHLAGPRLRQLDLGDVQRLAELLEHGGADLHGGNSTRALLGAERVEGDRSARRRGARR